jgi:predicted  nucleic acid-binding Zn-ribbon protein
MASKKESQELSIEEKLKNLYQLQTLLSEIDKIKTLRGELPLEVQDLEDEIEGLTTRIEKIQNEITELKAEVAHRRLTMQENLANIERYQEQLNNVRNNREYENLTKEIEYLQLDNQLCEKKIREAQELITNKLEDIERCKVLAEERRSDLDVKKSELDEIISETKAEEEKLRERSKNLETTIEPRLLAAFKRIRKNSRNGLGIVYVQRDACGGCFNKIPPQRQLDIRMRKKIIVCEYCGRIMIDPELAGVQLQAKGGEEKPKRRRRSAKKTEDTEA